jgi:monooxygenase
VGEGSVEHLDVLVIGAGISGIGAAYHLQEHCPDKSFVIFEARSAIGGTWDLFRYPGIRADSDMYTLGYRFKPWTGAKSLADGDSILEYIRETASENGIEDKIRFNHRIVGADWSSEDLRWTVESERSDTGETVRLTCDFLWSCSGPYRYDDGYTPDFEGVDRFAGQIVHPQRWPEDLDYAGKRVVVIGSGATAVTLVPALAEKTEHVTMLQRSPTYIISQPTEDKMANRLRRILPERHVYSIVRWKHVLLQSFFFQISRSRPEAVKRALRTGVERALPPGYDVDKHFSPRYKPWDQRVCTVPDNDLFRAISSGRASVVTDRIATFTERGIELESGEELEADIIVTATGFNLYLLGGMGLAIDGKDVEFPNTVSYKGMMLSGVPNFAFTIGYTNASWTLKADLTSEYVCRLLNHMDAHGHRCCVPQLTDPSVSIEPLIDFTSTYVQRVIDEFPKRGSKEPWRLRQNYPRDIRTIRHGPIDDGALQFSAGAPESRRADPLAV